MQSVSHAVALLAAATATVAWAAPDSATLIARLARRPPSSIPFAEVRFSSLLVEPLVVRGKLDYEGPGALKRRVEEPYRESTSIRDETVRVERDGESARTFALRRAPELRGLLTGMIGLLAGDSSFIGEHFGVAAAGDEERWRLDLTPTDDRLQRRLQDIVVAGRGAEPYCFIIRDTQGGASVMLLGAAAALPLAQPIALPELLETCGTE